MEKIEMGVLQGEAPKDVMEMQNALNELLEQGKIRIEFDNDGIARLYPNV